MKRRIFLSIFLLTMASVFAVSVALSAVFYHQLSSSVRAELRERATMLTQSVLADFADAPALADMRLTIVAPNGDVVYDDDRVAGSLPNHADREEIREALSSGSGESRRFSDTLGQETYNYAVRLEDGSVLRLAKTTSSMWGMFRGALPVAFAVVASMLVVSYFLSGSLTGRIVNPINEVRIDEDLRVPYDELAPFARTISVQRERIGQQMADLQGRTDTIEAIMDSMSEGIVLVNQQGFVLSINKSAEAIFSLSDIADGTSLLNILRDVELNEAMRAALSGTRCEINLSHAEKIYRVYFSPVSGVGAMILFLDVTERLRAEQLRREFSANVSHELKTPLTTIYGNAEMLQNGMVKGCDAPQFYGKIKDEAARLIALIEDIIKLSQLDERGIEAHVEDVELADVAMEVIGALESGALLSDVTIGLSGSGTFRANRAQMTELLYNLIDNAVKYNRRGGSVSVALDAGDGQAKISVSDTGIGIPKEAQGRVFERFYRVDKSRSKKTGGTGLGLAIVKHIVMSYEGKIELLSDVDQGTRITVALNENAPHRE